MKLTSAQLKQIIKEELGAILKEGFGDSEFYLIKNWQEIEDHDDFKEVIGDILVDVLENHAEEYEYGDNRNDHTSQSDSE